MKFERQPDKIEPGLNTFELKAILLVDDDKQLATALAVDSGGRKFSRRRRL